MDVMRGMQVLVRTIERGSLSAAARELRLSQPTVSKLLAALERELGVRLVERSTTRLAPTEAGQRFYAQARRLVDDYAEAAAAARGLQEQAAGRLRVNAPLGFGQMHLDALVRRFLALHPKIEIELILDDRFVDLVGEGVDLALRLGGPLPAAAVARTLATAERFFVAAPAYLARQAPIRTPADLTRHEFIQFAWLVGGHAVELSGEGASCRIELRGRYSINSALSIRQAVRDGLGLALAPAWLVQDLLDAGELRRVLPGWQAAGHALRLLRPSRREPPARVRLFADFLADALPGVPGLRVPGA